MVLQAVLRNVYNSWPPASLLTLSIISLLRMRHPIICASLGAIALGSLAWTGHGAAGEGNAGTIQMIGDLVHLLAAGAWLGALFGLGTMLWSANEPAKIYRALDKFASVGTIIVAAVVASGLVNGFHVVGWSNIGSLPFTLYGQLLLIKLALFGVMLGFAVMNRFRLTPAFGNAQDREADSTLRALRQSFLFETGEAMVILGLVAWLGTLAPPMSL